MPILFRVGRAGLLALTAIAALENGCQRKPPSPRPEASPPASATNASALALPPILPIDERLSRPELLRAVERTASAIAAGGEAPKDLAELAGRQFHLAIPIGCGGPSSDAAVGYRLDPATHTVRLFARPSRFAPAAWPEVRSSGVPPEIIEGFWLSRPWLRTEVCPALGAGPPAPAVPDTVAMVQLFEPGSSRLLPRGQRPYEATLRLRPEQTLAPGDLKLVLEGRLAPGDGPPVRCRSQGPDAPPVCLLPVQFSRVAFEGPAAEMIAEWTH